MGGESIIFGPKVNRRKDQDKLQPAGNAPSEPSSMSKMPWDAMAGESAGNPLIAKILNAMPAKV